MKAQPIPVAPGRILHGAVLPGREPAILFVHGGLASRYTWSVQWPWLASQGIAAAALDLAGHGDSLGSSARSPADHARDLTGAIAALGYRLPPLLVCHSYGVPVGIEYANLRPIRGLLGIGGGVFGLTPWWEKPLVHSLTVGRHLLRIPTVAGWLAHSGSRHPSAQLPEFFLYNRLPYRREPYLAMRGFWDYDGRSVAERIEAPVVLLAGSDDPVFAPAMAEQHCLYFQQGSARAVADCGHLLMAEQPETVHTWIERLRGIHRDPG